jgi:hypothetical protein
MKSVYCAVRTGSLNETVYASCLTGYIVKHCNGGYYDRHMGDVAEKKKEQ